MEYIGYGKIRIAVFDTKDEMFEEFSTTPFLEARCPRCEKLVSEEMTRCAECKLAVVWLNSRKWKQAANGTTPKAAIDAIRLRPWCAAEREALNLLKAKQWATGTLARLNKLRDLPYEITLTDNLRSQRLIKNALAVPTKKGQQNYWLAVAVADLCKPEDEIYEGDDDEEEF